MQVKTKKIIYSVWGREKKINTRLKLPLVSTTSEDLMAHTF